MPVDERHRDYSLVIGNLAGAAIFNSLPMDIDTDGPFALREIELQGVEWNAEVGGNTGILVPSVGIKFEDPAGRLLSQDFVASLGEFPYSGSPIMTPVIPQIIYPTNSTINVWIQNTGTNLLPNARVIFRGVSLHAEGSVACRPEYPMRFQEVPYDYPVQVTLNSSPVNNTPLNINGDADFALRQILVSLVSGTVSATEQYFLRLRDTAEKSYASLDLLALQVMANAPSTLASKIDAPFFNADRPMILVPEIYIKKNQTIYFDIVATPTFPQVLSVCFRGAKVYPK